MRGKHDIKNLTASSQILKKDGQSLNYQNCIQNLIFQLLTLLKQLTRMKIRNARNFPMIKILFFPLMTNGCSPKNIFYQFT